MELREGDFVKADKETKEKLLASAKAEFMEKGYMKSSLRKICANAGVTTGALYFFFQDKEDLFASIVEKPLRELIEVLQNHYKEDEKILSAGEIWEPQKGDHDEIAALLIHHLYAHYDVFRLLLTKSQGTRFENCVDEIVDMTDTGYLAMAESVVQHCPGMKADAYMVHWMAHMTIDAFIHLLTHEPDEQKALQHTQKIMDFITKGGVHSILIPVNEERD